MLRSPDEVAVLDETLGPLRPYIDPVLRSNRKVYVGLVKRPKTPLITSRDIEAQAAVLSERKQSGCGSLPDVISSSVETTELHASRSVLVIAHVCIIVGM